MNLSIVYLGIGSNMGDSESMLDLAAERLGALEETRVLRRSPIYRTAAWGKTDQPDFLNMVLEIETMLTAEDLLTRCKQIERDAGRFSGERWGPRPLDIDILLYGNETISTTRLTVPHLRMWERAFVLRPLADLRPDLTGPDGIPILHILARGTLAAQRIEPYTPRHDSVHDAPHDG